MDFRISGFHFAYRFTSQPAFNLAEFVELEALKSQFSDKKGNLLSSFSDCLVKLG